MWNWPGTIGVALLLATALAHSWAGERFLIAPLLRRRKDKILDGDLARAVLRFARHFTSVLLVMLAVILNSAVSAPEDLSDMVKLTIGIGFTLVGIADLALSRGRHVGWPLLLGAGVAVLLAF
ncbi:MAG: hypothetical protein AAGL98_08225 [Planctomycetota bacterium]